MCCYRRLACLLVILIVPLFVSGDQASAYFSEDSFVSSWKEKVNLDLTPCKQSAASFYTVCQGDTLWSISRRFGVDQDFIVVVNGIRNRDLLHPGQMLLLPGLPEGSAAGVSPSRGRDRSLAWPLRGELTSFYGQRGEEFHHGLDIAGDSGDPIRAADHGEVVFTGWHSCYGYAMILDHGGGLKTLYGHLSEFRAREGEFVRRGDVIAFVGATGRATGPHLHFEVRLEDRAVNPLPFLK
jgi:hypothetical protein